MNEDYDSIKKEIDRLVKEDFLIVVEGKNDEISLKKLGVEKIYSINKKPLFKAVEEISEISKDVVILTDLDREGKKIYSILNSALSERGIRIHNRFREYLFKNTSLKEIESLFVFVNRLNKFKDF